MKCENYPYCLLALIMADCGINCEGEEDKCIEFESRWKKKEEVKE